MSEGEAVKTKEIKDMMGNVVTIREPSPSGEQWVFVSPPLMIWTIENHITSLVA
jgi:hypothetical protein